MNKFTQAEQDADKIMRDLAARLTSVSKAQREFTLRRIADALTESYAQPEDREAATSVLLSLSCPELSGVLPPA